MRTTIKIGFVAIAMLALIPWVSATTVSECTDAINIVKGDLAGVEIGGGHPEKTFQSLDSKLDGALLKLQQGKFEQALLKLNDFHSKILDLQAQGKIADGTTTVATLLEDAETAIKCLENLIAGL